MATLHLHDAVATSAAFFLTSKPLPSRRTALAAAAIPSSSPKAKERRPSVARGAEKPSIRSADEMLQFFVDLRSRDLVLDPEITSSVMIQFAQSGNFDAAQELWDELIHSSFVPDVGVITSLMMACCRMGRSADALRFLRQVAFRSSGICRELYASAISCFGSRGELELMEAVLGEMASRGRKVDGSTANNVIKFYAIFGTLSQLETAYETLKKKWRVLIEEEGIRAASLAYMRSGRYHRLGEFLRDVGLGRCNVGNLLWNLLLLSYAVNFKMKSLQREFLNMVDAGFPPDLTTFNIRMLAFSRMRMLWDLHLSIEHMKHEGIMPDLVTYGCIIDAYMDRRMGKNLSFALDRMPTSMDSVPHVSTDPVVFEAFGKGDFQMYSEALLESKRRKGSWTYTKLLRTYLKRSFRSNQIFWNY